MKELLGEAFRICRANEDQNSHAYLPSRLVYVGKDDEHPRLVASQQCIPGLATSDHNGMTQNYIALSYCWGSQEQAEKQLKTTTRSIHDHLREIPMEKLPKTIYDAILVCRALEIQYIWIDALCIIQDDEDDWEKEATTMTKVYSNAVVTICAAVGDSCQSGFLQRPSNPFIQIPFNSSVRPSISGNLWIRKLPCHRDPDINIMSGTVTDYGFEKIFDSKMHFTEFSFANWAQDSFSLDIEDCTWNERGWTYQETRLSPRLLVFGTTMFHLCVGDFRESEDGTHKYDNDPEWGDISPNREEAEGDTQGIEFQRRWESMVRGYSGRSLSFRRDRLTAFSAIADHASGQTDGEYIAGLWTKELHRGLLWGHFGEETTERYFDPGREYTAPSWSWASRPNLVGWVDDHDRSTTSEIQLLSWKTTVGVNKYGKVNDGHITILAKICPIPAINVRHASIYNGMTFPFELLSPKGEYFAHIRVDWRHQSGTAPRNPVTNEEKEDGPIDRLFMILISSRPYKEHERSSCERERGKLYSIYLIHGLLALPTGNVNEYQRVGLFMSESRDQGGPRFWENIKAKEIKLV